MDAEDNYLLHRVALHACRINLHAYGDTFHACKINLHAYGDTLHACVVGKRHSKSNTKKSLAINLTRDFIINYAIICFLLLGISHAAGLTDNRNLNLTRIGHLVLNLCCNLVRELDAFLVAHLVGTDNHAQLATCLDGVSLNHARVAHGYSLKVIKTLDVSLDYLATGTGTCTRDGIANLNDRSKQALHLCLIMVSGDGIADICLLLIFLCYLSTIECVGQLALLVWHLTDIVQETGTLGLLRIKSQL